MLTKIKNIFFVIFFLSFVFFTSKYYFSEKNKILINKSRSSYTTEFMKDINELPVLENDTTNIIIYQNDIEDFKKKKKEKDLGVLNIKYQ